MNEELNALANAKTVTDVFSWANNLTSGVFGIAVVLAITLITYTTVMTYTRNERGAILSASFMMLITSVLWAYILSQPFLFTLSIIAGLIIISQVLF